MNPVYSFSYVPVSRPHQISPKVDILAGDQVLFFGRERRGIIPERRERALWSSAESGDLEVLKDMLEYVKQGKFDLNASTDRGGSRAVHRAAGFGNLEWLKLAHEEGGADLWVKSDAGELPIDLARQEGFQDIVAYLEAQQAKGTANPSERANSWLGRLKTLLGDLIQALQTIGRALLESVGISPRKNQ